MRNYNSRNSSIFILYIIPGTDKRLLIKGSDDVLVLGELLHQPVLLAGLDVLQSPAGRHRHPGQTEVARAGGSLQPLGEPGAGRHRAVRGLPTYYTPL